jgi:hypothetical protein
MNFQIRHNTRNLPSHLRPLHHAQLATCLQILQVPKRATARYPTSNYAPWRAGEQTLWGWLDCAKQNHRRLIRLHHPDRGGCHQRAATINAAWDRVRELLARRGVAYAN